MSGLSLSFDTSNAAFDDGNGPAEAARILRRVATLIENGHEAGTIRDASGNRVGSWSIDLPDHDNGEG